MRTAFLPALICLIAAMQGSPAAAQGSPAQRELYPPTEQAAADIAAAIKSAQIAHRRVILDFGGNWCTDCHVLDAYFHDPANKPILDANFILVHVNIGRLDANLDIAERYQIPLKKGVPAIAVLSDRGALLYSQ